MQDLKYHTLYKQSLHDKILQAAMEMFVCKGIKAVKMDDIATALTISKRTLYEIFRDKEDLLLACMTASLNYKKERIKHIVEHLDNVMDIVVAICELQLEDVKKINPVFISDLARYPRVYQFLMKEEEQTAEQTKSFFNRGAQEGYFLDFVNYDLIVSLLEAQRKYVIGVELYRQFNFSDLFLNMTVVPLRGFCTEKGIQKLDEFLKKAQVNK